MLRAARIAALAAAATILALAGSEDARACRFVPPPPDCAKTVYVSPSVPSVVVVPPGGGPVTIPTLINFKMIESPDGTDVCPDPPYLIDLTLSLDCPGDADGTAQLSRQAIDLGANILDVDVQVPDGPARQCDVIANLSVSLSDGMVLTTERRTLACLSPPVTRKGDVLLPLLDAHVLGPDGAPSANFGVHAAGGSTQTRLMITNNDISESFTGELVVTSENVSGRLPGMAGPQPPRTGVYTLTAQAGDHFPIAFGADLVAPSCPAAGDPAATALPTLNQSISLGPGESVTMDLWAGSFGACADGSCSNVFFDLPGRIGGAEVRACGSFNAVSSLDVPATDVPCEDGGIAFVTEGNHFVADGLGPVDFSEVNVRAGINGSDVPVALDRQGPADRQLQTKSWTLTPAGPVDPRSGIDTTFDWDIDLKDAGDVGPISAVALPNPPQPPFSSDFKVEAPTTSDTGRPGHLFFKTTVQPRGYTAEGATVLAVDGASVVNGTFPVQADAFSLGFFGGSQSTPDLTEIEYLVVTRGWFRDTEVISKQCFEEPPSYPLRAVGGDLITDTDAFRTCP